MTTTNYGLSLCADCITFDANGWDERAMGRPMPTPKPMSLLMGWLISPDEEDHICEGHFCRDSCDGCGTFDAGNRYCYTGTPRDTVSHDGETVYDIAPTVWGSDCEHPNLDDCGRPCHHLECPDCGILIDTPDTPEED